MSILNTGNDGLYNILIILFEVLLKYQELTRKDLIDICAPFDDQNQVRQTLNTWLEVGLFIEDKKIKISPECISELSTIGQDKQKLPQILRKLVFKKENNADFWNRKQRKSADISRALGWALCQDIYTTEFSTADIVQNLELKQFENSQERRAFNSDVTYRGFKSWAVYLGFAKGTNNLIIDLSPAIKDQLADVFKEEHQLNQSVFLERLRKELPVIDGGEYRLNVESELKEGKVQKSSPHYLSTSLSMSLLKLEYEKIIELVKLSDSDSGCTLKGKNRDIRIFSHVNLLNRN